MVSRKARHNAIRFLVEHQPFDVGVAPLAHKILPIVLRVKVVLPAAILFTNTALVPVISSRDTFAAMPGSK